MSEVVIRKENFFVLTGAPGAGKTTLLNRLKSDFIVEHEPAREVIQEQRDCNGNGLWDKDKNMFLDLLLKRSVEKFDKYDENQRVVFDRGIPDNIAYAITGKIEIERFVYAAKSRTYNSKVFILPPWHQIYTTDDERNMSFEAALDFHEELVKAYSKLNYELVEVPKTDVENRKKFVLQTIAMAKTEASGRRNWF